MKKYIVLKGQVVEYELTIKAVKRLNLRVKPDLRVLVSAYPSASDTHIENFIISNQDLILNALTRYKNEQNLSPTTTFQEGDKVLLLGRWFSLAIEKACKYSVEVEPNRIVLSIKNTDDESQKTRLYKKWERSQLENIIHHECQKYADFIMKHGKQQPTIKFKKVKSYWGLCSSKNGNYTVTFNTALIHLPIEVIRYVVAHEHAHLVYMNHSKQFYALLKKLYPTYAEQKKRLKNYTYLLR